MTTNLSLRHLSIRVPWHDAGWDGTVCTDPVNNASCLRLVNIHERRNDSLEIRLRGRRMDELKPDEQPPCLAERAAFMANFPITRWVQHPYFATSDAHKHYRPTQVEIPAFGAEALPFRWLRREDAEDIAHSLDIAFHPEAEDAARDVMGFPSAWLQDIGNQSRMLDAFFSPVEPERSLAFFYAKQVPHTEQRGRVLLGVGWVTDVGQGTEYEYEPGVDHPTRSMIWERMVGHSIRPNTTAGGFLLPYHAALERTAQDSGFDPEEVVVFAPQEAFDQFSYASEHVTHDQAIASLLAVIDGLRRAQESLGVDTSEEIAWSQERLGELWKQRGAFPGLGAALTAFDVDHGHLLAYRIAEGLAELEDPWPAVQAALDDPTSIGPEWKGRIGPTIAKKLAQLPDERRALLHLLARFDLTQEQATRFWVAEERRKAGIAISDTDLLENPYLLYESDRTSPDPIPANVVDRGSFPSPAAAASSPIPKPSAMVEPQDRRRVRAFVVSALEDAAVNGHTLLPQGDLVNVVRDSPAEPSCRVDGDLLSVIEDWMEPVVRKAELFDGNPAYQLGRLAIARDRISREVRKRSAAEKRHEVDADWEARLKDQLGGKEAADETDAVARREKVAALAELAAARFCVLVGPAGTGKTMLLAALCSRLAEEGAGVTLLAPTGKARVQLERGLSKVSGVEARTIAQFLISQGRYNPTTGRYQRSNDPPAISKGTVIIDESSMITEEQLDGVLDNVNQADRIILVGDPRQLPPIGAGRPFVDIVEHLKGNADGNFPRVGNSYAELTVQMRQHTDDARAYRHDRALGQWFGGGPSDELAEEAWGEMLAEADSDTVRFVQWDSPTDVLERLQGLLVEEIDEIRDVDDQAGFGASLGGVDDGNGNVYFNSKWKQNPGAGVASEKWQILSPIHATAAGVAELNRSIHRHFRDNLISWARRQVPAYLRQIPTPMGPEGIVYGDKVINTKNHRNSDIFPNEPRRGGGTPESAKFVANGEIGMVVGQFRPKTKRFRVHKLQVEFSTQPGIQYGFGRNRVPRDGGEPILELAYAITVHKAQGSEFGTTFVVIPESCTLVSRELLYTALTRQIGKVVMLHQGPLQKLLALSSDEHSETARRFTNLLRKPQLQDIGNGRYFEANLIHRTSNGTLVRSKSEVIVANELSAAGIEFVYEEQFRGHDGSIRLPDFTITDAATGETFLWEHLGMLSDPRYERAWEQKKKWYALSGVGEGGGEVATLIVTQDDKNGGIDSADIQAHVREIG